MPVPTGTPGFDYSRVSPDCAERARASAELIRTHARQTVASILAIGDELNARKADLGYRFFIPWLRGEFDWSVKTAERYMQVAREFRSERRIDTVSNFSISALYLLSARSTPEHIRTEAIDEATAGRTPSTTEVRQRIREARATTTDGVTTETAATPVAASVRQELAEMRPEVLLNLSEMLDLDCDRTLASILRALRDARSSIGALVKEKKVAHLRGVMHALGLTEADLRPV